MTDLDESSELRVKANDSAHRYEIWVDGELAGFTAYRIMGGIYALTHTEIQPPFEGRGLGSVLVRGTLDGMHERAAAVAPYCPFVRAYLVRHPEDIALVPEDMRAEFGLA